jgi:ABC-type amino acid transport substrate-binding protein
MPTRAAAALVLAAATLAPLTAAARCGAPEGVEITPFKPQNASRAEVGRDYDTIIERGYIEIGVYEDYPPYSWRENGELTGIDVVIAKMIAADLGVEARVRAVAAGETADADLRNWVSRGPVAGGRVVNVLLRVPYHRDFACRNELVALTGQYQQERVGIAWRAEAYPDGAPSPAYFRYDSVAVENDSISDFYLSSYAGGQVVPNMRRYRTTTEAVEALKSGAVNAVMGPLAQLQWGIQGAAGFMAAPAQAPGLSVGDWTIGAAVRHTYRQLGYAVGDVVTAALNDGRMAAIFAAYGAEFTPPSW